MKNIPFILILFVAGLLRLYHLGTIPSGFHSDEVMNGYVGRFTMQNGVDLYGNKLPFLYFDNFGDYPNILPMYLSGLSTYVFGVNEFAVRLPIALAGVITIFIVFRLALFVTNNKQYSLIVAMVLAISPWHIVLSRATAEGITGTMVFLLALWILFSGFKVKSWWKIGLAYILFALTYFLYPSYRILVPLTLLPTFMLVDKKQVKIISLLIAGFFFCLTLLISQTIWGKGRYNQTSVFSYNDVLAIRQSQAIFSDTNTLPLISRLFHNQYGIAAREILNQYGQYWSGSYLFTRGGLPARYQLSDQGLYYVSFGLICFIATILIVVKKTKFQVTRNHLFIGYLLLLSPLPAALTMEDVPNVHRSVLMSVMLSFYIGVMITYIWRQTFMAKKIVVAGMIALLCFEISYFWHSYIIDATISQAAFRHNEMKDISHYLIEHINDYDVVYVPTIGHLPIHYLFHAGIFDASLSGQFKQDMSIERVGKVNFFPNQCPSGFKSSLIVSNRTLVVDRAECTLDSQMETIETIKRADGFDAYYIRVFPN